MFARYFYYVLVALVSVAACSTSSETRKQDGAPGPDTSVEDATNADLEADGPPDANAADVAHDGSADQGVGCQLATPLLPGLHTRELTHGGLDRRYAIYLPPTHDSSKKTPAVLALHGGYGTADGMVDYTKLNDTADVHGFIVIYPEGHERAWNAGHCCGAPMEDGVDDVDFIRTLLDEVSTLACVDDRRVYATGMSNGSMMSHRLACELSDRIAAIAGVSGQMGKTLIATCSPPRRIPVLHIHGTDDRCASYNGGVTAGACLVGLQVCDEDDPPVNDPMNPPPGIFCIGHKPYLPKLLSYHDAVADTIAHWRTHNECAASPTISTVGSVEIETYSCRSPGALAFYKVIDGGHSWPGGPPSSCCEVNRAANTDIGANDVIWAFFEPIRLK